MIAPGTPGDHNSIHSEAAGQYNILATLWYLLKEYLVDGTITVACNGKSDLDQL